MKVLHEVPNLRSTAPAPPPIDLEAIEARASAATPGPWRWDGYVYPSGKSGWFDLTTVRHGMQTILAFDRFGMSYGQPVFRHCEPDTDRIKNGLLTKACELAVYEVAPDAIERSDRRIYRGDVIGFRNPDADFIAHARQDVTELLARVHELEGQLAALMGVAE